MKKGLLYFASMFLILTLILTGFGCNLGMGESSSTGSLTVSMDTTRSVSSSLNSTITTYEITLSHDDKDITRNLSVAKGDAILFTDLLIGDWTISVNALNSDNVMIASGGSAVLVEAEKVNAAHVQLSYLEGEGTFDLSVSWDEEVAGLSVTTTILTYPSLDSFDPIVMTPNTDNVSADLVTDLTAGRYVVTTYLNASDLFSIGKIEAFEIMKDASTYIDFSFVIPQGDTSITITDPESELFTISLSGIEDDAALVLGDLPVTVTALSDETVLSWIWYIDGVLQESETGDTLVLDDLETGNHSVTCLAMTDSEFGSETVNFSVSESEYLGR